MKIKKIYVSAFGSLKDFTMEFTDGFQVVYGKNEAGKTTVAQFLKAMFYGTGKRGAGQPLGIREKYLPFDGTAPAGRVFFEQNGTDYCIERQFRKSDSTDKVTLINIDTGKSEACESDIGVKLFGIGSSAFERSVFIGNSPEFGKDPVAEGEINRKLSNIALLGEDNASFEQVDRRLESAKNKLISKSGRVGSCIDDINECEYLKEQLRQADTAYKAKQKILNDISAVNEKIEALKKQYGELRKVLDRGKDIENAQKMREYLDLKAKLDSVTESLKIDGGTVADEMFIRKIEFGFTKLDNISGKIADLEKELDNLRLSENADGQFEPEAINERINKAKEELAYNQNRLNKLTEEEERINKETEQVSLKADGKRKLSIIFVVLAGLCVVSGAGLYFVIKSLLVSGVALTIGIVLLVLSLIIRPNTKKRLSELNAKLSGIKSEQMLVKSEGNNIQSRIENLITALSLGVNGKKHADDVKARLKDTKEVYNAEREKVLKFFGLPVDTDIEKLKEKALSLNDKAQQQKQIKISLSYLSRDLGGISYGEAEEKLKSINGEPADLEKAKAEATEITEELNRVENTKTALETELKTGFRGVPDPEDLRRKIESKEEIIKDKKDFCDAVAEAREVLRESFVLARKSYGGVLQEGTLENFVALTKGAYGSVTVSEDLELSAEKNGIFGSYSVDFLSRGTKDQAYMSLRLAISKLISENEPLPVILDDSLSQYDDERFKLAMDFLKDYAKDGQAVLFTCHKFVCDRAEEILVPVINI